LLRRHGYNSSHPHHGMARLLSRGLNAAGSGGEL
jgi:hypothetical protein